MLTISFGASLITNIIVLVGEISFVYWLEEAGRPAWIKRWQTHIKLGLSTAFLTYLFVQSWVNTYLGPQAFGLHWTFLNMLIVTMLLFSINFDLWQQPVIEAVLMGAYLYLYSERIIPMVVFFYAAFVIMLVIAHLFRDSIHQSRIVAYALLVVTGVIAILMVGLMDVPDLVSHHWQFWARQFGALIILGIVGLEYSRVQNRGNERNHQMALRAMTDGLTKLRNFGTFDTDLKADFETYQETGKPYSVYEVDIDWFKKINDTYGHIVGNRVLERVAVEMMTYTQNAQLSEVPYRLGGEEFAVIVFGELTRREAYQIGSRFKQRITQIDWSEIAPGLKLTVSIGHASVRKEHYSYNDIYQAADHNLYRSKQNGRNRVTLEDNGAIQ